jgi:cytochrome o ubiquinol oxidase subunit II
MYHGPIFWKRERRCGQLGARTMSEEINQYVPIGLLMRVTPGRSRLLKLLSLGATMSLGGCNWVVLNPTGPIGEDERSIILSATVAMLIIVVPVIISILAVAWKYRASNERALYMPEWEHSNKIAVVITLVPCTVVLFLAVMTWKSSHRLDPYRPLASEFEPISIDVMALDWKWLFIYPGLNIATVNEIAFPANVPVQFKISSASVMNSFFIPQLGGQIYAMPGMETRLSLSAGRPGTYDGISANFSGDGFSDMKFKANALSLQGFEDWVAQVRQSSRRMNSETYSRLAKPSHKNPAEYFSSVDGELFEAILQDIRRKPKAVAMGQGICSANKE